MNLSDHITVFLITTLPLLVTLGLFVLQWHKERRTLWISIKLFACLISVGILFAGIMVQFPEDSDAAFFGLILFVLVVVMLSLSPIAIIATALTTSIQLIRKEGLRPHNLLSFGAGILAIVYLVVWPLMSPTKHATENLAIWALTLIYVLISTALAFVSLLLILYVVASWLNLIPQTRKQYTHIVVLGAGLIDGRTVTPLLAKRIDAGIAAWHKNPGSKLVMSGGQGSDELVPEAQAMYEYAIDKGIPAHALVQERNSRNTQENLQFSFKLINADVRHNAPNNNDTTSSSAPTVLIVSDNYHVYRALLLAKNMGLSCDGRGSKTRLYFYINAMVREFVAFLVIWKQSFIKALLILWGILLFWFIPTLLTVLAKMVAGIQ
ncbi:YdcF family protein [Atopobium fossor]|uniref:YdcF family protein n=1 Tax=Atopobium fossor TaxID=39487 RepID=UPI0012EC0A8A|nr:YdcF family protein [Atopobium fossor]